MRPYDQELLLQEKIVAVDSLVCLQQPAAIGHLLKTPAGRSSGKQFNHSR